MTKTFEEFLNYAHPGARFIYHRGFLMRDRQDRELDQQASLVWDAYIKGAVTLVQHRDRETGIYTYIAIRRPRSAASYGLATYGWDDSGRELFGSLSGPRSTLSSSITRRVIRSNTDRQS